MNEPTQAEFNVEGQPAFPLEDNAEETASDSPTEEQTDVKTESIAT